MHQVYDCIITDDVLDDISKVFVPERDVFWVSGEDTLAACLRQGLTVHTREEFTAAYPLFALSYGALYHFWSMKRLEDAFVVVAKLSDFKKMQPTMVQSILSQQLEIGRGHIYASEWLACIGVDTPVTVQWNGKSYCFLGWEDWQQFDVTTKRKFILQWLRDWRQEDAFLAGESDWDVSNDRVLRGLISEYAGTFRSAASANCFAAAIAMVLAQRDVERARDIITEWLHQGPFFRLLEAQGYLECDKLHQVGDLNVRSKDVLVWHLADATPVHAAYAISDTQVFQKQGQGWDNPWQVLKLTDVWYNEHLKSGGYVVVHRRG